MNDLVKAIRNDPLVGNGTCSCIDECLGDGEIAEALKEVGITDEKGAIRWARDGEELHLEAALNARWGDDDDPQLKQWNEWKQKRKELEDANEGS